jgi:hypothetical protein
MIYVVRAMFEHCRPVSSVHALVCAWAAAVTGFGASAAERLPDPPIYTAPHVGGEATYGAPNPAWRTSRETSPLRRPFAEHASGVALMELPREVLPGAGYQRPHHALGFRSAAAESWLHQHGIDASNCYLPLVRLHTKLANSGAASGSFWVYARCALR